MSDRKEQEQHRFREVVFRMGLERKMGGVGLMERERREKREEGRGVNTRQPGYWSSWHTYSMLVYVYDKISNFSLSLFSNSLFDPCLPALHRRVGRPLLGCHSWLAGRNHAL